MRGEAKRWRANFGTGLAVVLPVAIAIGIFGWLFGAVSGVTSKALFFLRWFPEPVQQVIFINGDPERGTYWWWSLATLILVLVGIAFIGRMTRYYIGKKIIALVDYMMLKVPLLNRIYSAVKQVNEALTSKKQSAFKQVVLVEFPGRDMYSIGFITGERHSEVNHRTKGNMVSVFVSTTPNPTTGFLVFYPKERVHRLDMSVAEGIKYIISLGAVSPHYNVPSVEAEALLKERASKEDAGDEPGDAGDRNMLEKVEAGK